MSCNHFLVMDRDGHAVQPPGLAICTECGMATNVLAEIEAAKAADRYVDVGHPDYTLMLTEAHYAYQRAMQFYFEERRWMTEGVCMPLDDSGKIPDEVLPEPLREWRTEGSIEKLSLWQRFLRWIGWRK